MRRLPPGFLVLALAALAAPTPARAGAAADHAIAQLVSRLEHGVPIDPDAPEQNIHGIAVWQWLDEKLTEPVRRAFRDDLEIRLIQSPRFQYFNRERFRQILRERQISLAHLADPAAMKAFAAAGIDAFLSVEVLDAACAHPELEDLDAHCVLLAKLTDARTATIAWAGVIEGSNPPVVKAILEKAKPVSGTTRYRQVAAAIAASIARTDPLKDPEPAAGAAPPAEPPRVKVITLSTPSKDGSAGIGIANPDNLPFDLKAFQDELLVAIAATPNYAYIDPTHIQRLVATWTADSEAAAAEGKKTLAQAFALDGYLFGDLRGGDDDSLELSMRIVSLADSSEAWAGKFKGANAFLKIGPRALPQPPVPREEPPEPEALTLEDIERPLKPPIPQPELDPLPELPTPPRLFNPLGAALYVPIGLPRDALDAAFHVADRVPLLGAATSAVYRYAGFAHLCRLGTRERFMDEVTSSRTLTYGQLQARDEFPTFFPLVTSARRHYSSSANYILQASLGTLTIFDLLDATYSTIDRTPFVGTVATPVLLPLNYAWRLVPDDRQTYCRQVSPGRPESRLTFGSLDTEHPWSLLPNARSWPFTFSTPAARNRTYREFAERHARAASENDKRLGEWLAAEEARKRANEEALTTLRDRNAQLRRKYQQDLANVRRDNATARQRFENDKKTAEDHNLHAERVNILSRTMLDLPSALAPKPIPKPPAPPARRPPAAAPATPRPAPATPRPAPATRRPAPARRPAATPARPATPKKLGPAKPVAPKKLGPARPVPPAKPKPPAKPAGPDEQVPGGGVPAPPPAKK